MSDTFDSTPQPEPQAADHDLPPSASRRRWRRRSGVVVGSAASLAVGAVLGGLFEGIPVLLPPAAPVSHGPRLAASAGGFGQLPLALSDVALPATPPRPGPAASATRRGAAGTAGQAPAGFGSTSGAPTASHPAAPAGTARLPTWSVPVSSTGAPAGASGAGSTCSACSTLQQVTTPLQDGLGAVPGVGGTLSGAVGTGTSTVGGVLQTGTQALGAGSTGGTTGTGSGTSGVAGSSTASGAGGSGTTVAVAGTGVSVTVGGTAPSGAVPLGPLDLQP